MIKKQSEIVDYFLCLLLLFSCSYTALDSFSLEEKLIVFQDREVSGPVFRNNFLPEKSGQKKGNNDNDFLFVQRSKQFLVHNLNHPIKQTFDSDKNSLLGHELRARAPPHTWILIS